MARSCVNEVEFNGGQLTRVLGRAGKAVLADVHTCSSAGTGEGPIQEGVGEGSCRSWVFRSGSRNPGAQAGREPAGNSPPSLSPAPQQGGE